VHPSGETLAVGCTNGVICVLNTVSGEFITQLSISGSVIGCLDYSPDASLLAAGTQNGILHVLPVYDQGNSYDRVTILKVTNRFLLSPLKSNETINLFIRSSLFETATLVKCNLPILTLQWSQDCRYILTSVNENNYQEIILCKALSNATFPRFAPLDR
jgi:WD40 repeat protein